MTPEPVQRTLQDMPNATVGEWRWLLSDVTGLEVLAVIGLLAIGWALARIWRGK